MADRLKDTAVSSALSFGLLNVPGTVNNIIGAKHEQGKLQAQSTITQDVALQGAPQAVQSTIAQDMQQEVQDTLESGTRQGGTAKVVADLSLFDKNVLSDFNAARKNVIEYAKTHFPDRVTNKATQKVIGISRQGMDKLLSGNLLPTKYASAFHVPELIENAEYVASADNTKPKQGVNGYSYYDSPISIGGEDYVAHIRVRATDMGQKYYGHTISSEMAGIIDGIKIEPSARSSIDKSMLHPVKSLGSNLNIPQPTHDVNGDIVSASENIYRAPQWDERQRIDENNGTVYSAQSAGLHNRAEQDKIVELSAKLSVPIRFMNDTNANINGKYENGTI